MGQQKEHRVFFIVGCFSASLGIQYALYAEVMGVILALDINYGLGVDPISTRDMIK